MGTTDRTSICPTCGSYTGALQLLNEAIARETIDGVNAEIVRLREQRDYYMARSARRGHVIGGLLDSIRIYHKVQFGIDPFEGDGARARRAFVRRVGRDSRLKDAFHRIAVKHGHVPDSSAWFKPDNTTRYRKGGDDE